MTDTSVLFTAGSVTEVGGDCPALQAAVLEAAGGPTGAVLSDGHPVDVRLRLERSGRRFDTSGWEPVTRGVWCGPGGQVVVDDVGGSGFSQRWTVHPDGLEVVSRWTPSPRAALAARLLPSRFRLLRGQVLLHYPVLWWAAGRGRAPLHVSAVEVDGVPLLLSGPGGVGKSTLVARELATGARGTCDNLGVSDGSTVHGLAEPLRLTQQAHGRRTSHGRHETRWSGRVEELTPAMVVVVRRSGGAARPVPAVSPGDPATAERNLVAGTYAAGELQRFWPLAAALSLATGHGPVHPPVAGTARMLAGRLPCLQLDVAGRAGESLASLLSIPLLETRRQGVSS